MNNYKNIKFDAGEKVAVTVDENGKIERWGTWKTDVSKVFQDKRGSKCVLYLSPYFEGLFREFEGIAKKAPYCMYHQLWFGEFPYGSWCWAIRKCSVTNEVQISTICTDINPRGLSDSEYWIEKCKSYVPESVIAT